MVQSSEIHTVRTVCSVIHINSCRKSCIPQRHNYIFNTTISSNISILFSYARSVIWKSMHSTGLKRSTHILKTTINFIEKHISHTNRKKIQFAHHKQSSEAKCTAFFLLLLLLFFFFFFFYKIIIIQPHTFQA